MNRFLTLRSNDGFRFMKVLARDVSYSGTGLSGVGCISDRQFKNIRKILGCGNFSLIGEDLDGCAVILDVIFSYKN